MGEIIIEKVKVSKALAEAIESALKVGSKEMFLKDQMQSKWSLSKYLPLNNISVMKLAEILVKGYEVEKTKEEKVIEHMQAYTSKGDYAYETVLDVLNILEIKIEGFNK